MIELIAGEDIGRGQMVAVHGDKAYLHRHVPSFIVAEENLERGEAVELVTDNGFRTLRKAQYADAGKDI